jgi:glycosyltransferase involved in cell wall biosynthesis
MAGSAVRRCARTFSILHRSPRRIMPRPRGRGPLFFDARRVAALTHRNRDEVVVTTAGILNPNKCADAIIAAIAASPTLKKRCRYRLVGAISSGEKARLTALCKEVGYSGVDFLGEVDDETLTAELERADILSCLQIIVPAQARSRGVSASAIEGMKSGRPIIVSDAGFYSDLPDGLVFKVPGSVDVQALVGVLERLAASETLTGLAHVAEPLGKRSPPWRMTDRGTDNCGNPEHYDTGSTWRSGTSMSWAA